MIRAIFSRIAVSVTLVALLAATLLTVNPWGRIAGAASAYDLTWETKAPMPRPSSLGAVALGPDGKIYAIAGADFYNYFTYVQAYDPSINSWQVVADIPIGRAGHGAATVDGKIYAIGGFNYGGYLNDVRAYDPSSNMWTQVASMPTRRYVLGVAAVGGLIYAIGGRNVSGPGMAGPSGQYWLNTVEEYNPATDTWTTKAPMPTYRSDHALVAASNGKIYAIGGNPPDYYPTRMVEEYDPSTDTWTRKADMNSPRAWPAAVAASNGRIYVTGGADLPIDGQHHWIDTVEEYDPETDTWTSMMNMPFAVGQHGMAALPNGKVYVIGGRNLYQPLHTVLEATIVNAIPEFSCAGFEPPMDQKPVTVKQGRALPLKAQLFDFNGFAVTDSDITTPPVIQVLFNSAVGVPIDVTDQALPVGQGTDGNQFVFTAEQKWQYNLKTKNYTAAGTYTIDMVSGDSTQYTINPVCTATFVVE